MGAREVCLQMKGETHGHKRGKGPEAQGGDGWLMAAGDKRSEGWTYKVKAGSERTARGCP